MGWSAAAYSYLGQITSKSSTLRGFVYLTCTVCSYASVGRLLTLSTILSQMGRKPRSLTGGSRHHSEMDSMCWKNAFQKAGLLLSKAAVDFSCSHKQTKFPVPYLMIREQGTLLLSSFRDNSPGRSSKAKQGRSPRAQDSQPSD